MHFSVFGIFRHIIYRKWHIIMAYPGILCSPRVVLHTTYKKYRSKMYYFRRVYVYPTINDTTHNNTVIGISASINLSTRFISSSAIPSKHGRSQSNRSYPICLSVRSCYQVFNCRVQHSSYISVDVAHLFTLQVIAAIHSYVYRQMV